jgi:hypothetical protein
MKTDESGIVQMLQEKISEHEERIASFRQAINALMGGQSDSNISSEATPARRGRKRGRKKGSKNISSSNSGNNTLPVKSGKRRGRKPGSTSSSKSFSKAGRRPRTGETMEAWVIKQFNDGVPKSNRTLMERFNKETGRKLEMNGFAARIAMIKKKGNIRSSKNPSDGISYTGKKEWFENGRLRNEFLSKIK